MISRTLTLMTSLSGCGKDCTKVKKLIFEKLLLISVDVNLLNSTHKRDITFK